MKHIIIVDIDGTVSKVGDRLKYLEQTPPDWDKFYDACDQDKPVENIIELVKDFKYSGYDIIFCTGRREAVRVKTLNWLREHLMIGIQSEDVLMRKDGDTRHDVEAKPELLAEAGLNFSEILCILEDRNSMVAKWRSMGFTCLQVAEGDF